MIEELKPCRSCGRRSALHQTETICGEQWHYFVCAICGIDPKYRETVEEARNAWNTRAIEDALAAENARLREALTPSAATKAAYIGEVRMRVSTTDENGDDKTLWSGFVSWDATKEVMKMISARAALSMEPKP